MNDTPTTTYLLCRIGERHLGIVAEAVREVVELPWIEPATSDDPTVLGVIDYRANAIPVLSLAQRWLNHDLEPTITDHLVIIEVANGALAALHVSRAERLEAIDDHHLQDHLAADPSLLSDGSRLAKRLDGIIIILDPSHLTADAP
ncbi:MAG: chemotaxis protein CheW [Planctomycetota bacterium]